MVQYILRGQRLYFPNRIVFLSLKIVLISVNSADPDEMLHYAAFHLSLHYLPKYAFTSHQYTKSKGFCLEKWDYVILVTPFHI